MVSCVEAVKISFAKSSSRVLIAETPRPRGMCAVNRGRLALDIAEVGEGVRAVLLLDEVLNVDLVSHILNARMALVAVFLLDLLQLLLDNSKVFASLAPEFPQSLQCGPRGPCTRR